MTTSVTGVSNQVLLPEGRDDSTSIVLVRQAALARGNAISGDVVDWSPRRTQNQRAGSADGGYTHRVRPYASDEDASTGPQNRLSPVAGSGHYSAVFGTYASAAALYELYAAIFSAPDDYSLDIYI